MSTTCSISSVMQNENESINIIKNMYPTSIYNKWHRLFIVTHLLEMFKLIVIHFFILTKNQRMD